MKYLILVSILMSSCVMSHELEECGVLTVDTMNLSATQEIMVRESVQSWNHAYGQKVLEMTNRYGDIIVTSQYYSPDSHITLDGQVIYIGPYEDQAAGVTHALGTLLGLPDDELPRSVMHGAVWPAGEILQEHILELHDIIHGECP